MSIFDYIFGDHTRPSPRDRDPTVHTAVCERCQNPFYYKIRLSGKQRDSIEMEPLQKILKIKDGHEPVFCDGCFVDTMSQADKVSEEAVNKVPNMLLRAQNEDARR